MLNWFFSDTQAKEKASETREASHAVEAGATQPHDSITSGLEESKEAELTIESKEKLTDKVAKLSIESKEKQDIEWKCLKAPKFRFIHRGNYIAVIRGEDDNVWFIQDAEVYHCLNQFNYKIEELLGTTGCRVEYAKMDDGQENYRFVYGKKKALQLERLNQFAAQYFINQYVLHTAHTCEDTGCTGMPHCCGESGCVEVEGHCCSDAGCFDEPAPTK